jgi:hypothetical protein
VNAQDKVFQQSFDNGYEDGFRAGFLLGMRKESDATKGKCEICKNPELMKENESVVRELFNKAFEKLK